MKVTLLMAITINGFVAGEKDDTDWVKDIDVLYNLKEELIDEIILDVYPVIMAKGIRIFESDFPYQNLELISHKELNDQIVQLRYNVKKV